MKFNSGYATVAFTVYNRNSPVPTVTSHATLQRVKRRPDGLTIKTSNSLKHPGSVQLTIWRSRTATDENYRQQQTTHGYLPPSQVRYYITEARRTSNTADN